MAQSKNTLFYVHDPMCSWCWAFVPVWQQVQDALGELPLKVEYLLGGLAPDSDAPMPADMQHMLQTTWQRIQQHVPGTEFNFAFWTDCQPRRSTWPACRAVLAAGNQQQEQEMIQAIQQAYYLRALNPSDDSTLIQLAQELGLDTERFAADLDSTSTGQLLEQQMQQARRMPINGFPSLVLQTTDGYQLIPLDYNSADNILSAIRAALPTALA